MKRSGLRSGVLLVLCLFLGHACAESPYADAAGLRCRPLVESGEVPPAVFPKGLLWRLSTSGKPDSYLFGTVHVSDPRVLALPDAVEAAFTGAETIVLEAALDATAMLPTLQAMLNVDGPPLSEVLGPELFAGTAGLLESVYSMPPMAIEMYKPWAVYLLLSLPPPTSLVDVPLDQVLWQRGQDDGKRMAGLETLAEQTTMLEAIALDDQVTLVHDSVCHYDRLQADIVELLDYYLDADLVGLVSTASRYRATDPGLYDRMDKVVLVDRNARMVERMQPYLDVGDAFIAVGALHLPGTDGILARLKAQGVQLERLY